MHITFTASFATAALIVLALSAGAEPLSSPRTSSDLQGQPTAAAAGTASGEASRNPGCRELTNGCEVCVSRENAPGGIACSTPGIACQPTGWRCTLTAAPAPQR